MPNALAVLEAPISEAPISEGAISESAASQAAPTRDFTIDFLRAIAIVAVAVGHWLVVVPSYEAGHFDGVNALGSVGLMRWLSWIFQVMPLFFIVGGYANAISWRTARERGGCYPDWLRSRLLRLLKPTTALIMTWTALGVVLRMAGADAEFVAKIAWLVVVPLWFLAVYVVIVALTPPMLRIHERTGVASLVGLGVLAFTVDCLRFAGWLRGVEYTNFFWVFLFCQQLGFFWLDGRLRLRRRQPVALFVAGLAALFALTHFGPYPLSMVGVPGERIANNAPPTVALIALGLAQAGLGLMMRPKLERLLRRRAVAGAVMGLNQNAMTILLWHFSALVLAALVLLPHGILAVHESGSGAYWLVRIESVLIYSIPLAGLVAVFGRIESKSRLRAGLVTAAGSERVGARTFVMLVSTGLLAGAFVAITLGGLSDPGGFLGIPVIPIAAFSGGLLLLFEPRSSAARWSRALTRRTQECAP